MKSLNDIRREFLNYFVKHNHTEIASSPLVPQNDPTLLFTNAGMVQFKNLFTGIETRNYTRATSSQKCIRAGGKHNDLENVGYTARHHTFFEMLGNFSFGDYFKEEAIYLAWNLLTKNYGLDKDKLCVTIYHDDEEAFKLWKKIAGLRDDKIIRIATMDNFWQMGDTGPCGPCSEIFYDHGESVAGGPPGSPNEEGDRFIEVWNLVFMQYEQHVGGKRTNLPKPSIDTGMGIERLAAILQGQHNNYDTDCFKALIDASAEFSQQKAAGKFQTSHRVIADHLRSCAFLMADGVMPSNEGRGYVLRRIMRRAMRHAHIMGCKEPLIYRLVPSLIAQMGSHYTELSEAKTLIKTLFEQEEIRFKQTLSRGLKLLDEKTAALKIGEVLAGRDAFKLYDTYGFPLDLTQDILRSKAIGIDQKGFDDAMNAQKKRARAAWAGSGGNKENPIYFDLIDRLGTTEFLGYKNTEADALVTALLLDETAVRTISKQGQKFQLILNQTPFYAESGGQVGDSGKANFKNGSLTILDTQKLAGGLFIHSARLEKGTLNIGDEIHLNVAIDRRAKTAANHSATHLLHAALREVLGEHVTQKGSLVDPSKLRFDLAHPQAITKEEINQIEMIVNNQIRSNALIDTKIMHPDDAKKRGAMALFGEKYGDEVRVVSMGEIKDNRDFSIELCGGTHAKRTGDIGIFKITSEAAIASGVRRIEALTGVGAELHINEMLTITAHAAALFKTSPKKLPESIQALLNERKQNSKKLSELTQKLALNGNGKDSNLIKIGKIDYLAKQIDNTAPKELRSIMEQLKQKTKSGFTVLLSTYEGKASLLIAATDDVAKTLPANALVKIGAELLEGNGGGKPTLAQAGGTKLSAIDSIFDRLKLSIEKKFEA